MSLNLVSPGTKVREVDLTVGSITGANEQVGAIAGPFEKGPIDEAILIENEQDLVATFGKPLSTDAQYEYWLTASNYLSYGGILRVFRSDATTLNNANSGPIPSDAGGATVKIKSYDNYQENYTTTSNEPLTFSYASKDPGTWGNDLKVCTIDSAADQRVSITATKDEAANYAVGLGVTQSISGVVRAAVGTGNTSSYDGYLRGIVTGLSTAVTTGSTTNWDYTVDIKITDWVSDAGVSSVTDYGELSFATPVVTSVPTSTGLGTTEGTTDTAYDITITGITTSNLNGDASKDLAVGDVVSTASTLVTVPTGTKIVSIGTSEVTVDQTITGIGTVGFTFTRTVDTNTNTNVMYFSDASHTPKKTVTSVTSVKDWYNEQTLGLTNQDIPWKTIAEKPGTSQYASERSAKNDEMHVVVVDDKGTVTGIAGNIVEKHTYLSKAKDGKVSPTENYYVKDVIAQTSNYIYVGYSTSGAASGLTAGASNTFTATTTGTTGQNAQGVTFDVRGAETYTLSGGQNYTSAGGYAATRANVLQSYGKLRNPAEYDINFILQGPSGGINIWDSQAKATELVAIASERKDCIACISPHRGGVVNVSDSDTQTDNILDYYDKIQSSSYAVFDSGYKYAFDRWNNEYRYLPLNGDIAGLMARTSINSFSWFSPAGSSRGAINGAIKLAYNPSQAQRDLLYPKRINPVIASPGAGIILFGDKTGLGHASAFDRINVRRLFLTIEDTIERAARDQLFEFNDVITRSNFLNIVDPYLRDVKAKRGINEYVVICDETNNTPDVIDSNQFRADIFVKPARSINFIGLTFVATRTGVSFEEVVGNV